MSSNLLTVNSYITQFVSNESDYIKDGWMNISDEYDDIHVTVAFSKFGQ